MEKGIVVEGDSLSSGGKVVQGSGTIVNGFKIALLGDPTSCPIIGHGSGTIVEGDTEYTIMDRPVALEGHKASCGCVLTAKLVGLQFKINVPEPTVIDEIKKYIADLHNSVNESFAQIKNTINEIIDSPIDFYCKDYDKPYESNSKNPAPIIAKGLVCSFRNDYILNNKGQQAPVQTKKTEVNNNPFKNNQTKLDCSKNVYRGGAHKDTRLPIGDGKDSHHMPSKDAYKGSVMNPDGEAMNGPAIQMDPKDHNLTASKRSKEYRERQRLLIQQGKVKEAIQMDIKDVQEIAANGGNPGKYDCAIQEALEYSDPIDPNLYRTPANSAPKPKKATLPRPKGK